MRNLNNCWRGIRGREHGLTSLSQYADDTTEQIVAEAGEDVMALARRVQCSSDVLDGALAVNGFLQNRAKEELLVHLVGAGSLADRRRVREGQVQQPGKVTAFCSVGQLWYESRVSWRLKRYHFISRVVNTALSSIEAFCPSKAQYQSLTSSMVCLARGVMAGSAARRGAHEQVRTVTNEEVLRFWRLAPCDVEA